MSQPASAREALIVEALGDIATLLERVDALSLSMDARTVALTNASEGLDRRLRQFGDDLGAVSSRVKVAAVEHIAHRTARLGRDAVDEHSRAMSTAARQAFTAQLDPQFTRFTALLERSAVMSGTWERCLTHVATATVSASLTYLATTLLALH